MTEAPGRYLDDGDCCWFVSDPLTGRRPCANRARNRYGAGDFAVCSAHERKFQSVILLSIDTNPAFRHQLLSYAGECERGEAGMWAQHHKEIGDWPARPGRAHCVYFAERDGFVKIGRTSDLGKRIREIGKGSCMPQGMSVGPVRLLAAVYCECTARRCVREAHFHQRFTGTRLEGEWFLFDDALAGFIGGLEGCLDDRLRELPSPPLRRPA